MTRCRNCAQPSETEFCPACDAYLAQNFLLICFLVIIGLGLLYLPSCLLKRPE